MTEVDFGFHELPGKGTGNEYGKAFLALLRLVLLARRVFDVSHPFTAMSDADYAQTA